jgi:hypothetical protein
MSPCMPPLHGRYRTVHALVLLSVVVLMLCFLQVYHDCDRDSIIYLGDPIGPTCHTGARCVQTAMGCKMVVGNGCASYRSLL